MTFIGLIVVGAIQDDHLKAGNPYRLTNPMDYNGHICGYHSEVKHLKYAYYMPDLTGMLDLSVLRLLLICCSAVCVKSCPSQNNYEEFLCKYDEQAGADADIAQGYESLLAYSCMFKLKTVKFLNRCFPNTDVAVAATAASGVADDNGVTVPVDLLTYGTSSDENSGWFSNFLQDLLKLSGYIGGFGIGVATFISFAYLLLLRIPGILDILIWGIVVGIFVCLIVGSFLLWALADTWSTDDVHSSSEVLTMRVFAYIGWIVTFLYFCLIVVLRKRLALAVGIVKQAARALASMPSLLAVPLLQTIGITIFLVPWVIYVVYLASSGDMQTQAGSYEYNGSTVDYNYRTFTYTDNARYAFLYMLFCWFWTSEFIVAFGQLSVAMAFTAWYFNRDKSKTGFVTVKWAFNATFFYHMGSVAFGSLIIAIIKTIRAVLMYIQRQAKKSKNKILEYLACILGCIMWCIEKIMRFINKHAYIMTAIYGYSFCKGARAGFFLILRNILRVAAVNMVSSFLLFIGRLFIPTLTTFLCYLCIAYGTNKDDINGLIAPLVFTFLLSYWIAAMFLEIFGMGIETILCCYVADEEMFKVEDRFVEGELLSVFQRTNKAVQQMQSKGKVAAEIVVKPAQVIASCP